MLRPEDETADLVSSDTPTDALFVEGRPKFAVKLGAATHAGKVRVRNEDHHAVLRRSRSCQVLLTNLEPSSIQFDQDEAFAMVVADGMGGAAFGDFASRLALQVMFERACHATSWMMKFSEQQADEVRQRVDAYVDQIQQTFRQYAKQDPKLKGMGTTWTSAHLFPPHAILVHIGDSRAYLYRDGVLNQVTHDQTLAQELQDAGAPPEKVQAYRHVLTNSLTGSEAHVTSDIIHLDLESGDRLLLCTDGLSDMVDDAVIAEALKVTSEPQAACDRLVELALEGGGRDNITVVLGDLEDPE